MHRRRAGHCRRIGAGGRGLAAGMRGLRAQRARALGAAGRPLGACGARGGPASTLLAYYAARHHSRRGCNVVFIYSTYRTSSSFKHAILRQVWCVAQSLEGGSAIATFEAREAPAPVQHAPRALAAAASPAPFAPLRLVLLPPALAALLAGP
ncbi:hypothetical protein EVAR_65200_1 [Eumeta japonica]|uniref:Uncharacterized protein n=1 Tax=Eumeta variegata TaxID=151549 RepID=A0A4C1ZKY3_EUMVA|nr:hypothetical protein EVAR_65200_1 [Eumeta japonica]